LLLLFQIEILNESNDEIILSIFNFNIKENYKNNILIHINKIKKISKKN